MKLILTSFGISHLFNKLDDDNNLFYRMPPITSISSMSAEFLPDYAVLLLSDKIILDVNSFDKLLYRRHRTYGTMALMIKLLYDEGFIQLVDFGEVIKSKQNILEEMLKRDLQEIEFWIPAFYESTSRWQNFIDLLDDRLRRDINKSSRKENYFNSHIYSSLSSHSHNSLRNSALVKDVISNISHPSGNEYLREIFTGYLSYVNANLLLSSELEAGFYDWSDYLPFYREKFLRIAKKELPNESKIRNIKKLFEISFPEFIFWKPDTIIKALKDNRIIELRKLVNDAVLGKVEFNKKFAHEIIIDVFNIEKSIGSFRNFVSYLTMPLGLIPVVGNIVQKAIEISLTTPVEISRRRPYQWFYLISDLSKK